MRNIIIGASSNYMSSGDGRQWSEPSGDGRQWSEPSGDGRQWSEPTEQESFLSLLQRAAAIGGVINALGYPLPDVFASQNQPSDRDNFGPPHRGQYRRPMRR